VLIDGANPVFTAPPAWRLRETLAKIPFIASFGSFLDETSALSDLIFPDHSFLESWAEAMPESGSMVAVGGVAPAAMKPLHDTRATPDVLLDVSRLLARPLNLPWQTFEEMLTATFSKVPASSADTDAWTEAQEKGGWWGTPPAAMLQLPRRSPVAELAGVGGAEVLRRLGAVPAPLPALRLVERFSTARRRTYRGCRNCPIR
jgi:anaerobic selenocysteine-containing dehydrogenase